jgi:translation initiation factor IF-3
MRLSEGILSSTTDDDFPDYGKIYFERQMAARAARRRDRLRQVTTKEIHLRVTIAAHDFDTKVNLAKALLASRVSLRVSVDRLEPGQERLAETLLGRFVLRVEDAADGVIPMQRLEDGLVAIVWTA